MAAEETRGVFARKKELEKRLRSKAQKLRRTLAAIEEDAARAGSASADRRKAELLVAHASSVPRGAREARVPDWNDLDDEGSPREVTLQLDPAVSAEQNAARWFKRAQRYASALPRIAARQRPNAHACKLDPDPVANQGFGAVSGRRPGCLTRLQPTPPARGNAPTPLS